MSINILFILIFPPDCFETNVDYIRNDIAFVADVATAADCQLKCAERDGCTHFTFVTRDGRNGNLRSGCRLKNDLGGKRAKMSSVSGPLYCAMN